MLRRIVPWLGFILLVVFAAIQFVPVDRSNPPVEQEVPAPDNVRAFLRRACYDCHSNERSGRGTLELLLRRGSLHVMYARTEKS
jgi:hypothetical protein